MDNKNLRGLSEAYNEVYLGEVNLPFGFKPGEAQATSCRSGVAAAGE